MALFFLAQQKHPFGPLAYGNLSDICFGTTVSPISEKIYVVKHSNSFCSIKDTRITRCVTPYDFLAHDIFDMAPGCLEFLFETERALQRTALFYAYSGSRQLYECTRMLMHCKFDKICPSP